MSGRDCRALLVYHVAACPSCARAALPQEAKLAVAGAESNTSGFPILPAADSSDVYPVQVERLCRLPAATINRAWQLPENRARMLDLTRAGAMHLVVDTLLGAGERGRSVLMGRALTTVVTW